MDRNKKTDRIQLMISFSLLLLLVVTRQYLRPHFFNTPLLGEALGSLPNFIGAFLFSNIFCGFAIRMPYVKGLQIMIVVSSLVFLILLKEEYAPYFTASKRSDPMDIIYSAIGSLAAIGFYRWRALN